MASAEFQETIKKTTVAGPASEELVQAAERQLSLRFPSEYRSFVKRYGAVLGEGFEIAGVFVESSSGPPLWQDVVKATERFRESVKGMLPETLIPISGDGHGITYYVDTANADEGVCEVVAYGPGVDGKKVAGSLETFVVKIARNELDI